MAPSSGAMTGVDWWSDHVTIATMKRVFVFVLFIGVVISASLTIRYDEYLKDNPALGEWSYRLS